VNGGTAALEDDVVSGCPPGELVDIILSYKDELSTTIRSGIVV